MNPQKPAAVLAGKRIFLIPAPGFSDSQKIYAFGVGKRWPLWERFFGLFWSKPPETLGQKGTIPPGHGSAQGKENPSGKGLQGSL
ncbi:MAG: hypothetical protein A2600_09155 [Candidatus Lambdaproteobacteria bacterium RIFOXYD1_FULL_56_27]|uniref:Uncharacterized protein n=1 Tax=Candidatus Lambdaproteobacteria bacterium RIFOXYD2_FULL_56_26 TaxID=1817773 RepID=A0A1F6GL81_9PROT|nr:MAG: hypothetical protein A2557_13280 [Candidatus Lambdaproteobacteria bacterium RIFOXYD2_FULL_56_26]OGH03585.1 MAG: hypothetical protein A2426_06465 [Candidatus Lambdaproteobacteria bacterium RIFOXYC1_FULL_56_13]OGH08722.1 MAG: hypothetical protein A2600_09155 [Candidatus Lambdaproteobacteria bacterium RIFOXYD1_FULL_56_27]